MKMAVIVLLLLVLISGCTTLDSLLGTPEDVEENKTVEVTKIVEENKTVELTKTDEIAEGNISDEIANKTAEALQNETDESIVSAHSPVDLSEIRSMLEELNQSDAVEFEIPEGILPDIIDLDSQPLFLLVFQNEFSPSNFTVEVNKPVQLTISSFDKDFEFSIPELGITEQVSSLDLALIEFTPQQTGTFQFRCSANCGDGSSTLSGTLVVQ